MRHDLAEPPLRVVAHLCAINGLRVLACRTCTILGSGAGYRPQTVALVAQ